MTDQVSTIGEAEAEGMSRAQALRVLATADGVPARDRRIAELMLAGPDISRLEEAMLSTFRPKRLVMPLAVRVAIAELVVRVREEHAAERAEFADLGVR